MTFEEVVRGRRMTRSFTTDPVDPAVVSSILADALRAPSAGFAQGSEFLVLSSPERRETFWELVAEPSWREHSPVGDRLMRAPVVVLCLVDPEAYRERFAAEDKSSSALGAGDVSEWNVDYPAVDAAFSTMLVLLGAEAAGLGALFFHLQDRDRTVLDGLDIPSRLDAIGAVALGHRGTESGSRSPERVERRPTADRVHFEQYRAPS